MLRLLTRGSSMRDLYVRYLKERVNGKGNPSKAFDAINSFKELLTKSEMTEDKRSEKILRKKFETYRKAWTRIDGVKPSSA